MAEKSYLRNKNCCVCDIRLDRISKSSVRRVIQEDIEDLTSIRRELNKPTDTVITTDDFVCGKCRLKCFKEKKAEKRHLATTTVPSDALFPSTSTSLPTTSSPISKRVAFQIPSSSSSESSETSPSSQSTLNTTLEDLESEQESQLVELRIPITTKTHRHCIICPKVTKNLRKITESVQIDFLIKTGIWISDESRLCDEHFMPNRDIKPDHMEVISAHSESSIWETDQVTSLINKLRDAARKQPQKLFENIDTLNDINCENYTGLTKTQFITLLNQIPSLNTKSYTPSVMLALFLFRLKNGLSLTLMATIFGIQSFQTVARITNETRDCINRDFVPKNLGLINLNREHLISNHTTLISKTIFDANDKLITIWDGSYAYCQKSSNYFMQKMMYSGQKKRHLVKPFIGITSDGYYLDIFGPYDSSNDATIMNDVLKDQLVLNFFKEGDIFVVDRGFRDVVPILESHGFVVKMPTFLNRKQKQLTCEQANQSRKTTKVRYAVEVAIGKLKSNYRYLDKVIQNKSLPHIATDFRIAAAILNFFFTPIESDKEYGEIIAQKILERESTPNTLLTFVEDNNLDKKRGNFLKIDH
jgi:hypothetical protein